MVAKPIVKLIDEAIIPALVTIVAKVLGVLTTSYFLNINFEIVQRGFLNLLPTVSFKSSADYTAIENYSNLIMFTFVALGALVTILKAHFLHESHISPKLHQKLIKMNLEKLVTSSFHIYHQATIWLVFLWLVTLFLVVSTFSAITYVQISLLAAFIAVNFTWILAYDVQKELDLTD